LEEKIKRMARITDQGIKGAVGNVIFYTMNGKSYMRAKPGPRKKKRGQKQNPLNSIFGTVSKYGSSMIKRMRESFLFPFNRETYNKVRGWMRNLYAVHKDDETWELSVKTSGMCRLNAEVDLRDLFNTDITISDSGNGKITITIPAMTPKTDIKAPSRTMKVNIKLIAVTSPFRNGAGTYNLCTEQYSFIYNNDPVPAITYQLHTNAGTGDIALIAMALEYETTDTGTGYYNRELRWLPAAVIAMGRLK
jgi:hypothetical protein